MRIWVLVIPGADAVAPPPEPPEPLGLLEPQPAATSEAVTAAAMTGRRSRWDLFMRSLLPGVRGPAAAGTASRGPRLIHRPAHAGLVGRGGWGRRAGTARRCAAARPGCRRGRRA